MDSEEKHFKMNGLWQIDSSQKQGNPEVVGRLDDMHWTEMTVKQAIRERKQNRTVEETLLMQPIIIAKMTEDEITILHI